MKAIFLILFFLSGAFNGKSDFPLEESIISNDFPFKPSLASSQDTEKLEAKSFTGTQVPIIPLPNQFNRAKGIFMINSNTSIIAPDVSVNQTAYFLQKEILRYTGIPLSIQEHNSVPSIILNLNKINNLGAEAYILQMQPDAVTITASSEQGLFYGVISLLQMIRKSPLNASTLYLDCWNIQDHPRYSWRGVMLDESRHFFGIEKVKSFLDWMAFYKLNKFHWHLTDQQGWRFEIKRYPKLTLIGGIGNEGDSLAPAKYYTQEEIKEIVQYANERHISIIPEIDMPGHATAANHAYPEFSGGGTKEYPDFTFNPGKEETYQYLANILAETDVLFPSQMIHIGGDEVHYGSKAWETDVSVNSMMKAHSLPDLKAIEHYFVRRIGDSLIRLNNKILAWDEIVESGTPVNNTIVFWWRQEKPDILKKALDKGYHVVLCPRLPLYFDFVQDTSHRVGRKSTFPNSLDRVYAFSHESIPEAEKGEKLILGMQANLWTETVVTERRFDYLFFPRICALSEAAWTEGPNKNFKDFEMRITDDYKLFEKMNVNYFIPGSGNKNEPLK
ncbi:MAG: beta-N-acetylhexosaminidase [Ginsengibacter sp.]